jgi:hypothetical protein
MLEYAGLIFCGREQHRNHSLEVDFLSECFPPKRGFVNAHAR